MASYCLLLLNPGSEQKFSHRLPRACMVINYQYLHLVCLPLTGRKIILPYYQTVNGRAYCCQEPRQFLFVFAYPEESIPVRWYGTARLNSPFHPVASLLPGVSFQVVGIIRGIPDNVYPVDMKFKLLLHIAQKHLQRPGFNMLTIAVPSKISASMRGGSL